MAGLYLHIPFCRSRCVYCGFYSTTALRLRRQYVDALCREIQESADSVATIYLGGGTPSQLSLPQLRQLFDAIYHFNEVEPDAEVTIEVNPDDVTEAFADALALLPVNRVSMGVQTFDDQCLRWLKRRHTASQVSLAVQRLRHAGIRNISIDLIYGFPRLGKTGSLSAWHTDITAALALAPEHISAYCLMIEEGTPLFRLLERSPELRTAFPDEECQREMYYALIDRLEAAGYEHYEISNFALPGFRSRHNSSYWDGTPYRGIGAAAHSFDGHTRSWNVSDIRRYIDAMSQGRRLFEAECLDPDTRYNDVVTVALRTREGLDLNRLSDDYRRHALRSARRNLDAGLLRLEGSRLVLTRQGLFVSDLVMSDLMKV